MTYRDVYSPSKPEPTNGGPIVEFRSHDSDALDRLTDTVVAMQRDQHALHERVLQLIQEMSGAMARVQIPTPHVSVQSPAQAAAPDVTVEAAPPADVTVNVPEAQVTVTPIKDEWKRLKFKRTEQGYIDEVERIE